LPTHGRLRTVTRDETFCQAIQEALASGVPVVAHASGGPLDLVRTGENGLLFPPDDARALRAAVAEPAVDGTFRRGLARQARPSVRERDWATICDELIDHYDEVRSCHTANV
jgi:phosphatidylinositol alpha 1,6-mannosyltransferase